MEWSRLVWQVRYVVTGSVNGNRDELIDTTQAGQFSIALMGRGITRGVFNDEHLKNITAGNPKTKEQYQLTSNLTSNGFIQMMEKTGMRNKEFPARHFENGLWP